MPVVGLALDLEHAFGFVVDRVDRIWAGAVLCGLRHPGLRSESWTEVTDQAIDLRQACWLAVILSIERGVRCLLVLAIATAACGDDTSSVPDAKQDVIVYVVRHAETGSTATDPSLDATGQARPPALATP